MCSASRPAPCRRPRHARLGATCSHKSYLGILPAGLRRGQGREQHAASCTQPMWCALNAVQDDTSGMAVRVGSGTSAFELRRSCAGAACPATAHGAQDVYHNLLRVRPAKYSFRHFLCPYFVGALLHGHCLLAAFASSLHGFTRTDILSFCTINRNPICGLSDGVGSVLGLLYFKAHMRKSSQQLPHSYLLDSFKPCSLCSFIQAMRHTRCTDMHTAPQISLSGVTRVLG